jgi:hypothetical protein
MTLIDGGNKDCRHRWKYIESGYNPRSYYCNFYVCEKCGARKAEVID